MCLVSPTELPHFAMRRRTSGPSPANVRGPSRDAPDCSGRVTPGSLNMAGRARKSNVQDSF